MAITRRSFLTLFLAPLVLGTEGSAAYSQSAGGGPAAIVSDVFGNEIGARGIAMVDWDGYIANPAVKLFVSAPSGISFPATVVLATTEPRLFFDKPSKIGPTGARKTIALPDASTKAPICLSLFPDRDTADKEEWLWIQLTDANGSKQVSRIPIHIFDQDTNSPSPFKVTVDTSYDKSGFFDDPVKRTIAQQAADDWAYFVDDMHLDPVAVGAEKIWIFPPVTDYSKSKLMPNTAGYTGFLMEIYGVDDPKLRAGGEGSDQAFQSSGGKPLPIRRSGNVAVETQGNYNTLGWMLITQDEDWWKTDNRGEHQNELYSILHHEMGHAFFFNQNYPLEGKAQAAGHFESPELLAYHGHYPNVSKSGHLTDEIDDISLRPAFGNEYKGRLKEGRWIITKLDILCAETVGYKMRKPFNLAIQTDSMPGGTVNAHYSVTLKARGGLPWYTWSIKSGSLPDALTLDPDSGVISGAPHKAGNFSFTVQVKDFSEARETVSAALTISVA